MVKRTSPRWRGHDEFSITVINNLHEAGCKERGLIWAQNVGGSIDYEWAVPLVLRLRRAVVRSTLRESHILRQKTGREREKEEETKKFRLNLAFMMSPLVTIAF